MQEITYRNDRRISSAEFISILNRSTLGLRRPVHDLNRIEKMLEHGNVLITAWSNDVLVGVSRALTDYSYCCYLSDLAVDESFQHQGIGKKLVDETHKVAGEQTTLILLSAPLAVNYYPKIN
ncbi:MAG: GNAT family N-acetyltransferase, partial [Bacteroidia bacterium]|nr:GNAT family N-acetyltransferase [Bacteroidia bacterium]